MPLDAGALASPNPEVDDRDVVLLVDDEESVRTTFREWLESVDLGIRIITAADAETALIHANEQPIDLAILDWNLGAGNDGLQLLEDLYLFNPSVVAIMITGFAHQATPLDAMRMGVRDYFDKNQDLNRETFLKAVQRQLDQIRPAKRERRLHKSLLSFRKAVEQVLPLIQSAATLNDPTPLPESITSLFRYLMRATRAADGALILRSHDPQREPAEIYRVYNAGGELIEAALVPFSQSLAGTVLSMGQAQRIAQLGASDAQSLQSFEQGKQSLLAVPLVSDPNAQVIVELLDKCDEQGGIVAAGFSEEDRQLVEATAELGGPLFRHATAERRVDRVLFDALQSALKASDTLAQSLNRATAEQPSEESSAQVLHQLQESLRSPGLDAVAAETTVQLAEAIRLLATRHGPIAVEHCLRQLTSLRALLDSVSGIDEELT